MKLRSIFLIIVTLFTLTYLGQRFLPYFQQPVDNLSVPILHADPEQIYSLILGKGGEELVLTKEDQRWIASNGQWSNALPATRIDRLLADLQEVKALGISSQRAIDQDDFKVSKGRGSEVRIFQHDQPNIHFFTGTTIVGDSLLRKAGFLRNQGANIIYEVDTQLVQQLELPFSAYRNNALARFEAHTVAALQYFKRDSLSFELAYVDSLWLDSQGNLFTEQAIRDWLKEISQIDGGQFSDRFNEIESREQLAEQLFIKSAQGANICSINFYYKNDLKDGPFVIQSSQFPERFYLSDSTGLYQKLKLWVQ